MTLLTCPLIIKPKQPKKRNTYTRRTRKFVAPADYVVANKYDMLSKFESKQDFNNHFEQVMLLHKEKFTKSEYQAINKFRKFAYSEKFQNCIGVAWCNIATVVSATYEDEALICGVSRSTFERMLKKADELNIITIIRQKRETGWYKHNVYVFNRLEEVKEEDYVLEKKRKVIEMNVEKKEDSEANTPVEEPKKAFEVVEIVSENGTIDVLLNVKKEGTISLNLLELPLLKDLLTYSRCKQAPKPVEDKVIKLDDKDITNYGKFKQYAASFFEQRIISKIYGVWLSQLNNLITKPTFELLDRAIRSTIVGIKAKKNTSDPVKSYSGYFSGVLSKILDKWCYEQQEQALEDYYNGKGYEDYEPKFVMPENTPIEPEFKLSEQTLNNLSRAKLDACQWYVDQKLHELQWSNLKITDFKRYYRRYSRLKDFEAMLVDCAIVFHRTEMKHSFMESVGLSKRA